MEGPQETRWTIAGKMYTVRLKPGEDPELLLKAKKAVEDVGGRILLSCPIIRAFIYQIPIDKENPIDMHEQAWKGLWIRPRGNIKADLWKA